LSQNSIDTVQSKAKQTDTSKLSYTQKYGDSLKQANLLRRIQYDEMV